MSNPEEKAITPTHITSVQIKPCLAGLYAQELPIDEQAVFAYSETSPDPFVHREVKQTNSPPSLRVALYVRGADRFEQLSRCLDHARGYGYALDEIHVYCEAVGRSGIADPHDSAAITLLLQTAQRRAFSFLLVTHYDRLSRKQTNLAQLLDELHSYGIQVIAMHEANLVPYPLEAEHLRAAFETFQAQGGNA